MNHFEHLLLDITDSVATIRLNRPHVKNALSLEAVDEFRTALDGLKAAGARALIITGEGSAFCSGADVGGTVHADDASGDRTRRNLQQHYSPAILGLAGLDIPVVTAVNGVAAGIGCSIALAGDLIVAGRSAYFLQAFVNIGLVPDGGSSWLLPRNIGFPAAMEMMMLGERLPAEEAERIGLINWCEDDDKVMSRALSVATRLAAGPTVALGMIRQLARGTQHMSLSEALTHEADCQKRALESPDAAEGIAAFLEKRKAKFRGV